MDRLLLSNLRNVPYQLLSWLLPNTFLHTIHFMMMSLPVSCLDQLRILFLQQGEILLRVPDPDGLACKQEVHLLECAMVRLGIEGIDDGDSEEVARAEEVERFFFESTKHYGAEKGLDIKLVEGWK